MGTVSRVALICVMIAPSGPAFAQACSSTVTDPWLAGVSWFWSGAAGAKSPYAHVISTPLVAQLEDDNADGKIDGLDIPEIVVLADDGSYFQNPLQLSDSALVFIDGRTGTTKASFSGYSMTEGIAIADLDGLPPAEIIAVSSALGTLVAVHTDGSLYWAAQPAVPVPWHPFIEVSYVQLNVADLDGDGSLEVLAGPYVVNGQTGALMQTFAANISYSEPVAVDVDLDGSLEVLYASSIYALSSPVPLWTAPLSPLLESWPGSIQADQDPMPELTFLTRDGFYLFDDDYTLLASVTRPRPTSGLVSPGCTGDFDGDGEIEVAWSHGGVLLAAQLDGAVMWTATSTDVSGAASCSAFDLDGNGRDELLFAGETEFAIRDGLSGAVLAGPFTHGSATLFETPAIADIDRDGNSEILVAHNYTTAGVTAFENRGSGWPPSGSDWLVLPYRPGRARPDGVARTATISGVDANRVRSRPIGAWCGDGFVDVCESCEDGNRTSGDGCSSQCISEVAGTDAGILPDAETHADAALEDAQELDAGEPKIDAAIGDAAADGGTLSEDAQIEDAQLADAEPSDAAVDDAQSGDAQSADAQNTIVDAATMDAAIAELPDAASKDAGASAASDDDCRCTATAARGSSSSAASLVLFFALVLRHRRLRERADSTE
jgi:cysteine-rich repeat protein